MDKLNELMRNNGGYITAKQAKEVGRYVYYRLLEKVKNGSVTRVRRGVFADTLELANTMIDVEKIVPGGVICLYSAWIYHGLSTQVPSSCHVAIERIRKVSVPDYPPIILYYWNEKSYRTGIMQAEVGGFSVQIYNIEKSVCDAIRYRNKIGVDVSSEVVRNYLSRTDRNLSKLMRYAQELRITNTINKYLEIEL